MLQLPVFHRLWAAWGIRERVGIRARTIFPGFPGSVFPPQFYLERRTLTRQPPSHPVPDRLRVHLFRHGHLANSEKNLINGSTDVPLSDRGRLQMSFWRTHLRHVPAGLFVSSTLDRARESLSLLKGDRSGESQAFDDFVERRFGSWEGLTREEIGKRDPEGYQRWLDVDPAFAPEGGESLHGFSGRVLSGFDELVRRTGFGQEIMMVTHSGTNRVLLLHALGLPITSYFRFSQEHAAHNIIDFYRDHPPCVVTLNQTPESISGTLHG